MISKSDIENETQFAIIYLRGKALPCHTCGKQPDHDYQPGVRLIWCGGGECEKSVTDGRLDDGFSDWNSMQNTLAARIKTK